MVNKKKESVLKKLFAAFGRRPFKQQINVYKEWADRYSEDIVEEVVDHSINNEDKLPTIANLIKTARSLSSVKMSYANNGDDDCWPCGGTGQIPALCEPSKFNSMHHIRMYACKCLESDEKLINKYFSRYDNLQFEKEAKEYPLLNYAQFVDFEKNRKNKEIV